MAKRKKEAQELSYRSVILSDGEECSVRILGLFEARDIPLDWDEPFTYELESYTGRKYTVVFPFDKYEKEPEIPRVPKYEAEQGTALYDQWREYELYQAAKAHYAEMDRRVRAYLNRMTDRILDVCVSPDDLSRIITIQDIDRVREAALTRPVSKDILKNILDNQFKAKFDGNGVIDQLFSNDDDDGGGRYATILGWEVELMNRLGMSQDEYSQLDVYDRAIRICGEKLPSWMESLEIRKMRKESPSWQPSSGSDHHSLTV